MSVSQRFEKRLENLVEGAFAKVFKGVVHPVEVASAMQREAENNASILGPGRTLVPNRYVIDLSAADHDRIAQYAAPLAQELAQTQAEFIGEQGWMVYGDVLVEIERGADLQMGMFRVTADVFTGGVGPEGSDPAQSGPGNVTTPVPGVGEPGLGAPPAGAPYGAPAVQAPGAGQSAPPQPAAAGARLIAADGRQFAVAFGVTVIGRGEAAQIRLADVGISRQHARIDFDGSAVVLTDLGSTNGTTVNGNQINAVALQHGDVVQLGTTTLTFRLDG